MMASWIAATFIGGAALLVTGALVVGGGKRLEAAIHAPGS